MRQEPADHLYVHIAALPASQREALTLRYFAELPHLHLVEGSEVVGHAHIGTRDTDYARHCRCIFIPVSVGAFPRYSHRVPHSLASPLYLLLRKCRRKVTPERTARTRDPAFPPRQADGCFQRLRPMAAPSPGHSPQSCRLFRCECRACRHPRCVHHHVAGLNRDREVVERVRRWPFQEVTRFATVL